MSRSVGIFGGTFDPPHLGHLIVASEVRFRCGLDVVVLMVANDPWQKSSSRHITAAATRLEMVRVAIGDSVALAVGDDEIRRGGETFTLDTVRAWRAEHHGDDVTLIVGADAAAGIDSWHGASELADEVAVAVVDRPGAGSPRLIDLGPRWRRTHVETPLIEISSTDIRRRVAAGEPVNYLVCDAVGAVIDRERLYRDGDLIGNRVAQMVDVISTPASVAGEPVGEPVVPRKRPRPRMLALFAVVSLVSTLGAGYLVRQGYQTAREITGDGAIDAKIQPDEPNYIANVSPTPVHLLLLADDEGVVDFLVVAETSGGEAAHLLWAVGDQIVQRDAGPVSLEGIADVEGTDVALLEMETLLGLGIADATVLDPDAMETLFGLAGPLSIDNPDRLTFRAEGSDEVVYQAGEIELGPAEVNSFLLGTANREAPTNRATRAELVFEELFARLAGDGNAADAQIPSDTGDNVVAMFIELARGEVTFDLLGTVDQPYGDTVLYVPAPEVIASQVADAVPFPVAAFPGQRPRTYVLNGTPDLEVAGILARDVAAAGAEVVAIGNASTFDVTQTVVEYHRPEFELVAGRIAKEFGVDPVLSANQTDAKDVTVTLGFDASG